MPAVHLTLNQSFRLGLVSEKFIDRVVNQLGRQSVNVDAMKTKDLDQLSKVITQALQVVDGDEGVKGREVTQDERPEDEMEVKREPGDQSHPVEKDAPQGTSYTFLRIYLRMLDSLLLVIILFLSSFTQPHASNHDLKILKF